jgi:LysR family transcriptional activator of mexEF-oprN operon
VSNGSSFGHKVYRIGLSGDVEYGLLPGLLSRLRHEAPGATFIVRRLEQDQLAADLRSGEISVGLGYGREMPKDAHRVYLRTLRLKLMRSDRCPDELELDEYCRRPHAQVLYSGDVSRYIDSELERLGRSRRIDISLSQFSSLPLLMANTDLLATVPDYVADSLAAYGGLRVQPLPLKLPTIELAMTWDQSCDDRPQEQWLRSRLKMLLQDLDDDAR